MNAKNNLGMGTLGGVSTIWMATASLDIEITTIDINKRSVNVPSANWEMASVRDKIELHLGEALETLPKLLEEASSEKMVKRDMEFIGAEKSHGGTTRVSLSG